MLRRNRLARRVVLKVAHSIGGFGTRRGMYRRLGTDLTAGMIDVQQEFGSDNCQHRPELGVVRPPLGPSVNNQVLPDTSAANGVSAAVTCGCARVEYL